MGVRGWCALSSEMAGRQAANDHKKTLLSSQRIIRVICFFPRWRVGLSVSRRCGWLSHKRCDRSHTDRSNPTRAGPYPCGSPCSNFPQGKVRSQLRSAMSADGGARHGPVREESRFGPSRGATLLSLLKHRSVVRRSSRHTLRLVPRLDRVVGGFAWTQWLTTLTGESPTPSPGNRGKHVP